MARHCCAITNACGPFWALTRTHPQRSCRNPAARAKAHCIRRASMRSPLTGLLVAVAVLPALAQTAEGILTRIRGTVDRIEGQSLVVTN